MYPCLSQPLRLDRIIGGFNFLLDQNRPPGVWKAIFWSAIYNINIPMLTKELIT